MNYLSCDLETTGLDPNTCQILEVGIHLCSSSDLEPLDSFHRYLAWPSYVGDAFAFGLNAKILQRLGSVNYATLDPSDHGINGSVICGYTLCDALQGWLFKHKIFKICCAGKNFGAFDLQFLKRMPNFKHIGKIIGHRSLDPVGFYLLDDDSELPKLDACLARAGIPEQTDHTALADALLVHKLLHSALNR